MLNDPTYLGVVDDVKGATISVVLDEETLSGLAFIAGSGYRIGQVGSFVRIPMGFVERYGVVSQVGAGAVPERLAEIEPHGRRWMTVQLIGEGPRGGPFGRGLTQYPTIGDHVHLVAEEDLAGIYGTTEAPEFVEVGRIASAETLGARVDVNKLVTRHSAVVGATGAGKSTLVTSLLTRLSDPGAFPSARILVLDTHGEYGAALADRARVFRVKTEGSADDDRLNVPYWAMTSDDLLELTFGRLEDAPRGAVIEKIVELKSLSVNTYPREGVDAHSLTADTPVPFSIHRLWFELHELVYATHTVQATGQSEETRAYLLDEDGNPVQIGDALAVVPPRYQTQAAAKVFLSGSGLNIRRQLEALASRLRDPRFDFLFKPGRWTPALDGKVEADLSELLEQWIGSKAISVFDLSGVPSAITVDIVGAVVRIVYDALFWGRYVPEGGRLRPLLLVLEEAHTYLGAASAESAKDAVRRVVKEGRKYGIGAMVVSQRPAEVDQTILSQCGTIFAMRLSNAQDRGHVTNAVSDHLEGLLSALPILRTGEAIVIGEAVPLPLRLVTVPPAGRYPESADPLVYQPDGQSGWNRGVTGSGDYGLIAKAWRSYDAGQPESNDSDGT